MSFTRRDFLMASASISGCAAFPTPGRAAAKGESIGGDRPLMTPVHDLVVCPWTPQHPRHDHRLIFPLDEQRLLLVWSEYYASNFDPAANKGTAGAGDEVSCQISSMVSTDRGRTWGDRRVMQPNEWKHNVKHPNLVRNTNQRQYFSISEDGGDHWSEPAPSVLPSPESPALVKRIPTTGDLLVLWNNVASPSNWPRTPLTAAILKDEAQSWTHFHDIDHRKDFDAAYASVTFVDDEALVAYYSRSTQWKLASEITLRIYKIEQFYGT